jgi:predicted DNA-binding transcriptional regulator AlpA
MAEWLTTRQAIATLACSRSTLYRWAEMGILERRRLGPASVRWRIRSEGEIEERRRVERGVVDEYGVYL